jgi:hypothetical protein
MSPIGHEEQPNLVGDIQSKKYWRIPDAVSHRDQAYGRNADCAEMESDIPLLTASADPAKASQTFRVDGGLDASSLKPGDYDCV